MYEARDEVLIVSCADDARAAGKTGYVLDEVPPGHLTQGRWTVKVDSIWIADVLCESDELQKTGNRR